MAEAKVDEPGIQSGARRALRLMVLVAAVVATAGWAQPRFFMDDASNQAEFRQVEFTVTAADGSEQVVQRQVPARSAAPFQSPTIQAIDYGQDVTPDVIVGTAIANGEFTTDRRNGIELALRGALRFNAHGDPENTFNSNGDGSYSFAAGQAPGQSAQTPVWSFHWSVNSDFDNSSGLNLDDLVYEMGLDGDPGLGTDFLIFDPVTPDPLPFFDHAIGDNTTPNGGGTVATNAGEYLNLLANNNVAQNAWRYDFFPVGSLAGFDPEADGRYNVYLSAIDPGTDEVLAHVEIVFLIGDAPAETHVQSTALSGDTPTASDNDFTRIDNAIQAATSDSVITLEGTFDWTEAHAKQSWAGAGYGSSWPADVHRVTITSTALGDAIIQGPGDIPELWWEGVFSAYGPNQGWEISNLSLFDFDLSIGMFYAGGGVNVFDGTRIINNHIRTSTDLAIEYQGSEIIDFQNVAIHYSLGDNQLIAGNLIEIPGDGVGDTGTGFNSATLGIQSTTSGSAYEGLVIEDNVIRVLNAQSAEPEYVVGIWENGAGHDRNITVRNNHFESLAPGNDPALNRHEGFRIHSQSGQQATRYEGNSVTGAHTAYAWLSQTSYSADFASRDPVEFIANEVIDSHIGVQLESNGAGYFRDNDFSGATIGIRNITLGERESDATCNWWGSPHGPGGEGSGFGAAVEGNVLFAPWNSSLGGACDGQFTVPDTVYVDDDYAGLTAGTAVTFTLDSSTVNATIGHDAFAALAGGISAVANAGTVYIASGDYPGGRLVIGTDLTIEGVGGKPVISPDQNMTGGDASNAWILVEEDVEFSLENVVLDGDGYWIYSGLRSHGNTTIDNVEFRNIRGSLEGSPYQGIGIASFGGLVAGGGGAGDYSAAHLEVSNSTFEQIGRIGIVVKGDESKANIIGNTYTGKGEGDFLDYFVDVGAEASVNIIDNTVSGNHGVASSDGSTSAAILVTSYWGDGPSHAHIEGNHFVDNHIGVGIGFDADEESVVSIEGNSFVSNRHQFNLSYDDPDLLAQAVANNSFDVGLDLSVEPGLPTGLDAGSGWAGFTAQLTSYGDVPENVVLWLDAAGIDNGAHIDGALIEYFDGNAWQAMGWGGANHWNIKREGYFLGRDTNQVVGFTISSDHDETIPLRVNWPTGNYAVNVTLESVDSGDGSGQPGERIWLDWWGSFDVVTGIDPVPQPRLHEGSTSVSDTAFNAPADGQAELMLNFVLDSNGLISGAAQDDLNNQSPGDGAQPGFGFGEVMSERPDDSVTHFVFEGFINTIAWNGSGEVVSSGGHTGARFYPYVARRADENGNPDVNGDYWVPRTDNYGFTYYWYAGDPEQGGTLVAVESMELRVIDHSAPADLDQVYVDDDFVGESHGASVSFTLPDGSSVDGVIGLDAFPTLAAGISTVADGGTVYLASGDYLTGRLAINNDLAVVGVGDKPVISPADDMLGNNAADAWILVDEGVAFNLSNVIVDGQSSMVNHGLRSHGDTTIDSVEFRNIQNPSSNYAGMAVLSFGGHVAGGAGAGDYSAAHLEVSNSTFEQIGRIAVLVKGSESTATIANNGFVGKGSGDHLDYAVDVGAEASATITGNIMSNHRGVASSDGSNSAGIIVTSFWGTSASTAFIEGNTFANNLRGISVGYNDEDANNVTIENNSFTNNRYQVNVSYDDLDLIEGTLINNTFDRAIVVRENPIAVTTIFSRIQDAIDAADEGHSIVIAAGDYTTTDQVLVDKSLSIHAEDSEQRPVITPDADVTGSNAADAWWLIEEGVKLSLADLVFDGDEYFVHHALRNHGHTTIDSVSFRNIQGSLSGRPYQGIAVLGYGGIVTGGSGADSHGGSGLGESSLTISNTDFEQIGRVGVLVKGTKATADLTGLTYTGKGSGDFLDYAFEAGAGAQMSVSESVVSDNLGVADTDGSTSAAVMATTYFGDGTSLDLQDNVFSGSSGAVVLGYNEADTTHLVARNNQIVGNNVGMLLLADSIVADAECNWWGHASGPGGDGTGLGDPVIGPVTFQPWNTQPDGQCDGIPADLSLDIVKGVDPALVENGFAHFTATLGNTGGAVPEKVVLWVEVDGIDDADVAGGATLEFYENGQWNSFGWAGQASWQLGRDAWFIGRDGSEVVGFEIPENFTWPIPIRVNWDEGGYPLTVTIESTDGTAGPGERVYLNVSSTIEVEHYAAPELGISPTSFDFGQVGEFDAAETTFTVTNQGSSGTEIVLGSIDIAGTDSGAFHISGGSCSSGDVLVGGAGCDIEVSFVPGAQGTFADAELTLLSDANDVAASLTGMGIEPDWSDHFDGAFDQPDWQFFAFDGSPTLYEPATAQIVDDYLQINDPAALYAGGYIPRSFGESRVATLTNADGTNTGASPDNQIDHGVLSHFDPVLMEGYGAYVRYELNYQALVLIKFDAANLNPALIDERVEIATSNDDVWSMDRMYVVELDVVDHGGEALIVARAFDADTGALLGTVEASDSAPLAAGYAGVVAITNSTGVNGTFDTASAVSSFASADLSDALIDFGAVDAFADSAPRTITVDNRGNAELLITELSIGGSDAGEFSLSNSTCDTAVAAGDSCSFEVVFTPDGIGPALAEVVVESNASTSPDVVLLEGEGAVVEATVTLSDLEHVYDGDPKSATVVTDPAGLNVVVTYEGQEMQPTDAGSYAVEASIDDPNYSGSASGMLVIAAASVELVFDDLVQVYDGSEKLATVTTVPLGVDVEVTYDGASAAPVDAGSYLVYAETVDPNYQSVSDNAVFVIEPGQAEVLLTDLVQTYDNGNPLPVTVTTDPAGLDVIVTYDGVSQPPSASGSYVVFASVDDANWSGSANGMLVVEPAEASLMLDGLNQVYDGTPRVVTATTVPAGLVVEVTYDGLNEAPTDAGSYQILATIDGPNHTGSLSDTLVVSRAEVAAIEITDLEQTYDGQPKAVVVTTDPAGLDVIIHYDGSVTAPVDVGNYLVEVEVVDANYSGTDSDTLVVNQGSQTIDFPALADRPVDDSPFAISASSDSGLTVAFNVVSGPASIDGSTVTLTGELGEVVIEATQGGDDNWLPADPVQQSFVITEGDGHSLEAVSATVISGQSGEPVDAADLPTVRVLDQHDNPVAGMAVSFEVTSGGGSVSGSAQVTDDQGLARVGGWILGNESAQTLIATAPGLDGSPVEFTAEVDAVIGLEISITDNRDTIEPGERNTYVVVASNAGPNAAVDATVSVELPLHLVAETADWSCYAGLGATCTASGTGGIDDNVTLAAGSSVVYVLEADVDPRAHGQIEVQAILALDEDQATDSTTTTVINVADSIFQDRFEPTNDNGFTVNAAHIQGHLVIGSGFRGGLPPRVLLGGRDSGGNDVFRVRAFERDDLSLVRIELRDGVGQWQQSGWLEMQPARQGVLGFEYDPAAGLLMLVGERTDSMIQSSSRSGVNVSSLYTGSGDQVEIVLE